VTRLDRLARSTRDLLNVLATISEREAGFRSLKDTWADTTTPHGRLKVRLREPGEHTSGPNLASRNNIVHNPTLYTILETPPPLTPLCRKQARTYAIDGQMLVRPPAIPAAPDAATALVHFAERNVMERRNATGDHCGLMPANLITFVHLSTFSAMNLANSSGEFDATATAPRSANQCDCRR